MPILVFFAGLAFTALSSVMWLAQDQLVMTALSTVVGCFLTVWAMEGIRLRGGIPEQWKHSYLSGVMSIFHQGEMAFGRGIRLSDNPYKAGSPEARSWAFGWLWSSER